MSCLKKIQQSSGLAMFIVVLFFASVLFYEIPFVMAETTKIEKSTTSKEEKKEISERYVVITPFQLSCQIEGKGDFGFVFVIAKHKNFEGPQPMLNKGVLTGLKIGKKIIELNNGKIEEGGFIDTKEYGKIRLIGIENPFYLWVTQEQKEKLMKLK